MAQFAFLLGRDRIDRPKAAATAKRLLLLRDVVFNSVTQDQAARVHRDFRHVLRRVRRAL